MPKLSLRRAAAPLLRSAAGVLLLPATALAAAAGQAAGHSFDPYTGNDPVLMEEAGYLSFGPFPWGWRSDTGKVAAVLGDPALCWIETEHFRIGSTLPSYRTEHSVERRKIRGELQRLAERIPGVRHRTRELDPWLRLHLYAQRLEDLYAQLVEAAALDPDAANAARLARQPIGSLAPRELPKFAVLLCEKRSTLGRYLMRFHEQSDPAPTRIMDARGGHRIFGTHTEAAQGGLRDDTQLHCHVVFHVTHMLVQSDQSFGFPLPLWIPEGLAHCQSRRIDPRHPQYSAIRTLRPITQREWNWAPRVRDRVRQDYFPPLSEMLRWMDYGRLRAEDHMMLWSRMDHLLAAEPEKLRALLRTLREAWPASGQQADPDSLALIQEQALRAAFSLGPAEIDRAWSRHVRKRYPSN